MTHSERIRLAKRSLLGISIGDAFGESFFGNPALVSNHIQNRTIPDTSWEFTDDTVMAIAVFEQLAVNREINQEQLARQFARNHTKDPNRGYGATARRILREISEGGDWRSIAQGVFEGMGSMGNGASMRVGPIGAYFFDDLTKVKEQAILSAEITHSNIEGIAGAIAVAIGTAVATKQKLDEAPPLQPNDFIQQVVKHLPDTDTKSKIAKSMTVPYSYHTETLKSILGNGSKIMAQDTVPFSLWCAAHHLTDFEAASWKAISILGDRDTICAIVGGITVMSSAQDRVPKYWLDKVENFEESVFMNDGLPR